MLIYERAVVYSIIPRAIYVQKHLYSSMNIQLTHIAYLYYFIYTLVNGIYLKKNK